MISISLSHVVSPMLQLFEFIDILLERLGFYHYYILFNTKKNDLTIISGKVRGGYHIAITFCISKCLYIYMHKDKPFELFVTESLSTT